MKSARLPALSTLLLAVLLHGPPGDFLHAEDLSSEVLQQIADIQAEKAARTPVQRKLDSQLLYLSREAAALSAIAAASPVELRVAREADGRVITDIAVVPRADLRRTITALGGTVLYESPRWHALRASLPPVALTRLAAEPGVISIRCADRHQVHTGPVNSAGDATHLASQSRANTGLDGTGIRVGIISDSVNYIANSIGTGELPASFAVLAGRAGVGNGEGTAMAEILHDLAPGAELLFATGTAGMASCADSILQLRSAGCRIIVDDVSYFAENPFQDDVIALAVNQVVGEGVLYFSAAGNGGSLKRSTSSTWEGDFVDGGAAGTPLSGGRVHSFGALNYNRIPATSTPGFVVLHWSDEGSTSANDYDLFVLNSSGTAIVAASTNPQNGNSRPYESVVAQPGERVVIWKSSAAADRYLRLSCSGGSLEVATTGNIAGHAGAASSISVAATDARMAYPGPFTAASRIGTSSSDGPRKIFYRSDGTPITAGNFLAGGGTNIPKPDLTAAEGVSTSVPGFAPFNGTSAAVSHAAAIAALAWSKRPTLSAEQIRAILNTSCIDIEDPGFDINSGGGILMAGLALTNTPSPSLTPTNIVAIMNGSNLNLLWPIDHTGWRLRAQTNRLGSGISTNPIDWVTVPYSSVTNRISVSIVATNRAKFFQLIYP